MSKSASSWQKSGSNDKHAISSYGSKTEGYSSQRKDLYEGDAKAMAGKEKREMEALFGNKSKPTTSTASASKAFQGNGKSNELPSIFKQSAAGGTLMNAGATSTMKADKGVFNSTTGGAAAGKSVASGGVSKMNMGSAGVMQSTSAASSVDIANRGKFGGGSTSSGVSKMNMGSAGVMDNKKSPGVDIANRGKFGGGSTSSGVSKMNMGSAGVMDNKKSPGVDVANRGKFGGTSGVTSGVSKMSMGSAGVMDTKKSPGVDVANRGNFGKTTSSSSPGGYKGATKTESRDPMSKNGVLRKMPWE